MAIEVNDKNKELTADEIKAVFHRIWGYAHENPELVSGGYDKQAFKHVSAWIDLYIANHE